jgi:two-component system, chemotaxis family, CheB/CheR fusion protein
MALAIHELATNALKYGALSKASGRIDVNWQVDDRGSVPELTFNWIEKHGPRIDGPPSIRGFGTELLEKTVAYELKGKTELEFLPPGLRCTIKLPLSDQVLQPVE